MNINKKCPCGASWKASGIPDKVAEFIILEWELSHSTHLKKEDNGYKRIQEKMQILKLGERE